MDKNTQLIQLRTKKLGVLLFDARSFARKTIEECAQAIGVSPEKYREYEKGEDSPALPELESFAYFLDIPLSHFWGNKSLSEKRINENIQQRQKLHQLRDKIIGASLRMARTRLNLTLDDLAEKTSILESQLRRYELGESPIPLSELEILTKALNMRIEEFFDTHGPIGKWRSEKTAIEKFLELPADLQDFVCKPVNRPYLELAIRLNELSVEKLRAVAEGLLEITY